MAIEGIRFINLRGLRLIADVEEVIRLLSRAESKQAQIVACVGGSVPPWHLAKPADFQLLGCYGLSAGGERLQALRIVDGAADARDTPPCGLPFDTLPASVAPQAVGAVEIATLAMPTLLECLTPLLARYAPWTLDGFNHLPDRFEDVDRGLGVLTDDVMGYFGIRCTPFAHHGFSAQVIPNIDKNVFHDHCIEGSTVNEAVLRTALALLLSTPADVASHVVPPPLRYSYRFTACNSEGDTIREGLDDFGFHKAWCVMRDFPGEPSFAVNVYEFDDSQESADQLANVIAATDRLNQTVRDARDQPGQDDVAQAPTI